MPTPAPFPDPIPGILPFGTLTVFVGAPGVGKTAMLAEWVQRWREGRSIWGHPTHAPRQFAYVAADRHWATNHQRWFDLVGFPDIPHYSLVDDPDFDPERIRNSQDSLELLEKVLNVAASGYPPVPGAHVIVDPAVPIFINGNVNAPRDVIYSLIRMARMAEARQINLTIVGHFGKQKGDQKERYTRPQDRIAGSYAFSGYSDTQIYLTEPEGDEGYYSLGWVPRGAAPDVFRCTKDDRGLFIPFDVIKEDTQAQEVLDCFDEAGPTSMAVIKDRMRERHGYSDSTIKRTLTRLLDDQRICKIGRGRYQRVKVH